MRQGLLLRGAASVQLRAACFSTTPLAAVSFQHRLEDETVFIEEASETKGLGEGRMFAVVVVSGKQYRVTPGDVIMVDSMDVSVGDQFKLNDVLLLGAADLSVVGCPYVANAEVNATVEEQTQTEKVLVFKKKRRKGYKRRMGHRSDVTVLRINSVQLHD